MVRSQGLGIRELGLAVAKCGPAGHNSGAFQPSGGTMMRWPVLVVAGSLVSIPAFAQPAARPMRVVLIVDSTEAVRQPIATIRKALTAFVEGIDPAHEMMLVSVAGTPQVRVRPTADRQQVLKSVNAIFGTSGANVMHRVIDDVFHR